MQIPNFKDKVALIVGANHPLVRHLAQKLYGYGCRLVLMDKSHHADLIDEDKICYLESEFAEHNFETLRDQFVNTFGLPNYIFNLPSFSSEDATIWDLNLNVLSRAIKQTLIQAFFCVKAFVPLFIEKQSECHILNFAFASEFDAQPYRSIEAVTNQNMVVFSECLHHDLQEFGSNLKVSVVCLNDASGEKLQEEMYIKQLTEKLMSALGTDSFYIFGDEEIKKNLAARLEKFNAPCSLGEAVFP
jgi:NAD(P)-dependent dehydrogenase (short-subunit alcohol dehydrogenase family)